MEPEYYSTYKDEEKSFNNLENVVRWMLDQKGFTVKEVSENLGISQAKAKKWVDRIQSNKAFVDEMDIANEAQKLAKSKQKLQDMNRVNKKIFREDTRVENAVGEYSRELVDILSRKNFSKLTKKHRAPKYKAEAVLHLSDVHFNELVEDQLDNKYDFKVASKRLKLYVDTCRTYLKGFGVKNIVFAMTGDMMNSDRRLDELLCQAQNRSNATYIAVDILHQMLLDLNKDFNIRVAYVVGNEGRKTKDIGWADAVATDNYDTTIFNILKLMHRHSKGIEFVIGDPVELVVNVAGQNVLLIHSHGSIKHGRIADGVRGIIGRYATKKIILDYVIMGHIHEAHVSDFFARNASLVGANAYGDRKLGCISRASQNLYIFHQNGLRDGIKIDLQEVENVVGYDIDETLATYNAKSADKVIEHPTEIIVKI
jgi:predicted transcriptional regulator